VLGARARLEPGDEHGLDLLVAGAGMLAPELGQPHGLAEGAQVEGGPEAGGDGVRRIIAHGVIVGWGAYAGKFSGV
jgi:hypothetical protein